MLVGVLALLTVYAISRKFFTIWCEPGKKYLTRIYVVGRWFRTVFQCRPYLNFFHNSDSREFHNHRWAWSYGIPLWFGYREYRIDKHGNGTVREYRPFTINRLNSDCFHRVELLNEKRGCLTLFLAGPFAADDWGFLREDGTIEYASERFAGKRDSLSDD